MSELWLAPSRYARPILEHPELKGRYPHLAEIGQQWHSLSQKMDESVISFTAAKRNEWLDEFEKLQRDLREKELPSRFFFSPLPSHYQNVPIYSRRRLPTGLMEAAFDTCFINRNWDGLDRIDDLATRDFFEDIDGVIHILKYPLHRYLSDELAEVIALLRRTDAAESVTLEWRALPQNHETLIVQMLDLAERYRFLRQLPNYEEYQLTKLDEDFKTLFGEPEKVAEEHLLSLSAYVAEMMRSRWQGYYRPLLEEEAERQPDGEKIPALALELPFGATLYPFQKLFHAYRAGRPFSLSLHFSVLNAHRRQAHLQEALGQELYSEHPERRKAALRILCELADFRVEALLLRYLPHEKEPDALMRILARLHQGITPVPISLLKELVHHSHDGVAGRALLLLARQNFEELPEVIAQLLAGGARLPLRPLARQILEKLQTKKAKKILRSLGPIPLLRSHQNPLPIDIDRSKSLKMTAEILENCDNPVKREAALRIFSAYPDSSEIDAFGSALADPERSLRSAAIALLSNSSHSSVRKLLTTRLMLENDPFLRLFLKEILSKEFQSNSASTE